MKKLKLILFGLVLFIAGTMQAQVSVRLNIGLQPQWAPVGHTDVQYYYLPDVEAYYDVQSSMFIYLSSGRWVHRSSLPSRYRNYDLYHGYKVVMQDYHGNSPYSQFKEHRMRYHKGYRGEDQRSIGERPMQNRNGGRALPTSRTVVRESQQRQQNQVRDNGRNAKKNNEKGGKNDKKR